MKIAFVGSLPPYKDGVTDHNYFLFSNLINYKKNQLVIIPSEGEKLNYPKKLVKYILPNLNPEKDKFDIYHLQFGNSYPNSYVYKIFNQIKDTNSKVIVTLHGTTNTNLAKILRTIRSDPAKLKYEINKPSLEVIIDRADKIIVYSHFLKNYIEKKYNVKDKLVTSYIGANSLKIDTEKNFSKHTINKSLVISSYGAITPRKGFDEVIRGLGALKKDGVRFKYNIIGNFNYIHYKFYLIYLIRKLNLHKEIIFHGYKSLKELQSILRNSDIIIQPRLHATDGASASLPTAMLSGTAVITTDVGSSREYVTHRKTGILAKHEMNSYKNATLLLYKNNKLRQQLGLSARKWVNKNLLWKIIARKHLLVYRDVLKK